MTPGHTETNGKRNGIVLRWCGLIITLLTFFGAGVAAWTTTREKLAVNTVAIGDHEARVRALEMKQERILTLVEGMAAKQGVTIR